MRIASEETWKKNRVHIEEKDKEHVLRTLVRLREEKLICCFARLVT